MRPGEHHINRPYHLRGECCRTSCRRVATFRIHFYSYRNDFEKHNSRNGTYACSEHGDWWTKGISGMSLGTGEILQ